MNQIPAQAWIAFFALIFTILGATVTIVWAIVWKMSDIKEGSSRDLDIKIKSHVDDRNRIIDNLKRDFDSEIENVRKAAGEVGHSAQSKISEIEKYIRDRYLLKEDFREDFKTISNIIDALGGRLEKRMENIEDKLDDLQEFNVEALKRQATG